MAKLLLVLCAILVATASARAQPGAELPPAGPAYPGSGQSRPAEHERRQLDETCRVLKDQLELELEKGGKARRLFQARLADNAGTRFCREGQIAHGLAEFRRGLSFLQGQAA